MVKIVISFGGDIDDEGPGKSLSWSVWQLHEYVHVGNTDWDGCDHYMYVICHLWFAYFSKCDSINIFPPKIKSSPDGVNLRISLFSTSCEALCFPLPAGLRKDIGATKPTALASEKGEERRAHRLLKGGQRLEKMLSWQIPLASLNCPHSIYFLSWRLVTRRLFLPCFHYWDRVTYPPQPPVVGPLPQPCHGPDAWP